MADLATVQGRGRQVFTALARREVDPPIAARPFGLDPPEPTRPFSWFHLPDAQLAAALSLEFAAVAESSSDVADGLDAVLDRAITEDEGAQPGLVRQALAMFVTHHDRGRNLAMPRTSTVAPELFSPSPPKPPASPFAVSEGGPSPQLDYWREDAFANQHHEHWHQVYPFTGRPVAGLVDVVQNADRQELINVLTQLDPAPNWPAFLDQATPERIAAVFVSRFAGGGNDPLRAELRRRFLESNDRHGELFIYMHAQMLARYDAELLSHGLDRVEPWGPGDWRKPVPVGHNPVEVPGFGRRPPDRTVPGPWADDLDDLQRPVDTALASGVVRLADGGSEPLNAENVGGMLEAAAPWVTNLDTTIYRGLHNNGHGVLGSLTQPGGVMNNPVVAIRDPIFWRWHKHVDNLAQGWADTQAPHSLLDAPDAVVRDSLAGAQAQPWGSPDVILVDRTLLPAGMTPEDAGVATFGGTNWDVLPEDAVGPAAAAVTSTLTTRMADWDSAIGLVRYLTHDPFGYYFRVHNPAADEIDVTLRVFMAPAVTAEDRRSWIEMDKFRVTLSVGDNVIYRPDTESSVIKRPAETDPATMSSESSAGESGYCDCGWPYTLLLPRGTTAGMGFNLMVLCTDWTLDQVQAPDACGSMSFCGAVDRYPDQREMGYPFNRPTAATIAETVLGLSNGAGRALTIIHAD